MVFPIVLLKEYVRILTKINQRSFSWYSNQNTEYITYYVRITSHYVIFWIQSISEYVKIRLYYDVFQHGFSVYSEWNTRCIKQYCLSTLVYCLFQFLGYCWHKTPEWLNDNIIRILQKSLRILLNNVYNNI